MMRVISTHVEKKPIMWVIHKHSLAYHPYDTVLFAEVWKTWSRRSLLSRNALPMASCRSCWNGWRLPRSLSLIWVHFSWFHSHRVFNLCCSSLLHSEQSCMSLPNQLGSLLSPLSFSEAVVSSGRVEKSPHEQEIKFFAKVWLCFRAQ